MIFFLILCILTEWFFLDYSWESLHASEHQIKATTLHEEVEPNWWSMGQTVVLHARVNPKFTLFCKPASFWSCRTWFLATFCT